ncbi:hypothetical protein Ancab_035640 [Ancistrocladus abbreviatus]
MEYFILFPLCMILLIFYVHLFFARDRWYMANWNDFVNLSCIQDKVSNYQLIVKLPVSEVSASNISKLGWYVLDSSLPSPFIKSYSISISWVRMYLTMPHWMPHLRLCIQLVDKQRDLSDLKI